MCGFMLDYLKIRRSFLVHISRLLLGFLLFLQEVEYLVWGGNEVYYYSVIIPQSCPLYNLKIYRRTKI